MEGRDPEGGQSPPPAAFWEHCPNLAHSSPLHTDSTSLTLQWVWERVHVDFPVNLMVLSIETGKLGGIVRILSRLGTYCKVI